MIYQPEFECMSRDELESLQLERLQALVKRVYEGMPFYTKAFDDAGFDPSSVESLDDLRRAPFTVKQDLRDGYPFGFFMADKKDVRRIHCSSGTTGTASVVGYTQKDLDVWADCFARAIGMAGGTQESTLQVSYGYGLFTGGLGAHDGGTRFGCTVLPTSSGNTKRQVELMHDFGVDLLACTPSYALYIADTAIEMGYDPAKDFKVTGCILGAEPCSTPVHREIERKFGARVCDIYGLSEVMGPGVSCECEEQNGLHFQEDHFILEVIDPESLQPVPDGQWGELVITTLSKDCSPLIRYRTRDISRIIPGECGCGRTTRRIDRIAGRTDDMLILRGVNVFPSQIEQVIAQFDAVAPWYQVVLTSKGVLDDVELRIETVPDFDFDEIRVIENLQRAIRTELKNNLQIAVNVHIVEPKSIPRSEGKTNRVLDLRNKELLYD